MKKSIVHEWRFLWPELWTRINRNIRSPGMDSSSFHRLKKLNVTLMFVFAKWNRHSGNFKFWDTGLHTRKVTGTAKMMNRRMGLEFTWNHHIAHQHKIQSFLCIQSTASKIMARIAVYDCCEWTETNSALQLCYTAREVYGQSNGSDQYDGSIHCLGIFHTHWTYYFSYSCMSSYYFLNM